MSTGSCLVYSDVQNVNFDDLVREHAPLVKRIAHHLMGRLPDSVQVDDLIQAGMIGLLEAARKYDGGKGASFETYAGIRIRGAMLDEIRKGDWA
ncbi:MAG: sigma-70 family RNA polymerase sigma factor, partial [Thalassolituus sp.]